jgi:hypothetical protein
MPTPQEMTVPATGRKMTIEAKIIRADGRKERLGTVVGGTFLQKVESYLRIKFANLKQWLRY